MATGGVTTWEDPESLHYHVEGPGPRFGDFSVPAASRAWRALNAMLSVLICWESCLLKRDKSIINDQLEQVTVIDRQLSAHLLLSVTQMLSFSLSPLPPPPHHHTSSRKFKKIWKLVTSSHKAAASISIASWDAPSLPLPAILSCFTSVALPPGTLGSLAFSCCAASATLACMQQWGGERRHPRHSWLIPPMPLPTPPHPPPPKLKSNRFDRQVGNN